MKVKRTQDNKGICCIDYMVALDFFLISVSHGSSGFVLWFVFYNISLIWQADLFTANFQRGALYTRLMLSVTVPNLISKALCAQRGKVYLKLVEQLLCIWAGNLFWILSERWERLACCLPLRGGRERGRSCLLSRTGQWNC